MKKKLLILAGVLLMAAAMLLLGGCGESDDPYAELDLDEYLKVADYKDVEVKKVDTTVKKNEIGDEIVAALDAAAVEKPVAKGQAVKVQDTVNIDYVGRIDGKKFDGGSAEGAELVLGSGSFIEGFEEGLIDHKVGEKGIKLNLAFPLNYGVEDLQGKDVVFTVNINSAMRLTPPEFDLDFVKTQGDYKSTEEYEKAIEEKLKASKKAEALESQKDEIWSKVLGKTKMKKYPKDMVGHYIETYSEQMDAIAEEQGKTREDIMLQFYGITSEDVLQKQFKDSARLLVKQEMLIEYIAQKEGITYTDDEAAALKADLESQGYDNDLVKQQTGRSMNQYVHIELLYQKVRDFLLQSAKVVK